MLGKAHAVDLPKSIIQREELLSTWARHRGKGGHRSLRVACALVGACTRIGRLAKASYEESGCDPVVYGGLVYDYLRTEGGAQGIDGIAEAAMAIEGELVASLAALEAAGPRANFFAPTEDGSTAP